VAFLPLAASSAFALGVHVMVPLWVALACGLPMMRTGRRAWSVCLALVLPIAAALAARRFG
jgi:hypothetical protein